MGCGRRWQVVRCQLKVDFDAVLLSSSLYYILLFVDTFCALFSIYLAQQPNWRASDRRGWDWSRATQRGRRVLEMYVILSGAETGPRGMQEGWEERMGIEIMAFRSLTVYSRYNLAGRDV